LYIFLTIPLIHPCRFREQFEEWVGDVSRDLSDEKRVLPHGHRDFKYTMLPARDGIGLGGIRRSNMFPNCSFFTNWDTLTGKIVWPIEVLEDGDYSIEIYYTCARGDEGSELKISFKDNFIMTKIIDAHDPPLIGMENDRVKRRESYDKVFKALDAGTIHLKQGKGELTLEAVSMPGSNVIDVRMLMVERK
jgi:hypothetical protein